MTRTPRRHPLTWADLDRAADYLAERLAPAAARLIGVHGVPRGGLPLAAALAHRLGLPYLERPGRLDPFLLVDDIHDTGATLRAARDRWPRLVPAFWVHRGPDDAGILAALYHDGDDWFVFPWEPVAPADRGGDASARRRGARP